MKTLFIYMMVSFVVLEANAFGKDSVFFEKMPSEEFFEKEKEKDTEELEIFKRAGDGDLDPGGETEGEGGFVGELPFDDDSHIPLLVAAGLYAFFLIIKKKKDDNAET